MSVKTDLSENKSRIHLDDVLLEKEVLLSNFVSLLWQCFGKQSTSGQSILDILLFWMML